MARTFHALYLQHTDRLQDQAVAALRRIHRQTFPDHALRILVVDNAITAATARDLSPDVTLIDGDNRYREFSGWDRGWRYIVDHRAPVEHDVVCLCNETFMADPEADDFYSLDATRTAQRLADNQLLGHLDGVAHDLCVFGTWMRWWIKSNLVLMNARVMRAVSPLVLPHSDDDLFVDDPLAFFRVHAGLSVEYTTFIKNFLEGRPNIALWRWHSARPFDQDNLAFLRLKARAILSEHALSARATRLGFSLADLSRPRLPSKGARHRMRHLLFTTHAWKLVPRFRKRFPSSSP